MFLCGQVAENLTRAAMIQQLGISELRIRGGLVPRQHPLVSGRKPNLFPRQ